MLVLIGPHCVNQATGFGPSPNTKKVQRPESLFVGLKCMYGLWVNMVKEAKVSVVFFLSSLSYSALTILNL